ncbi:hypothetical protein C0991_003767, partial [Blastosporella zonata]
GRRFGDNRDNVPQNEDYHNVPQQAIWTPPLPNQRRRTHASQTPNQHCPRVNRASRPSQQEPSTGGRPLQSQCRCTQASQV